MMRCSSTWGSGRRRSSLRRWWRERRRHCCCWCWCCCSVQFGPNRVESLDPLFHVCGIRTGKEELVLRSVDAPGVLLTSLGTGIADLGLSHLHCAHRFRLFFAFVIGHHFIRQNQIPLLPAASLLGFLAHKSLPNHFARKIHCFFLCGVLGFYLNTAARRENWSMKREKKTEREREREGEKQCVYHIRKSMIVSWLLLQAAATRSPVGLHATSKIDAFPRNVLIRLPSRAEKMCKQRSNEPDAR